MIYVIDFDLPGSHHSYCLSTKIFKMPSNSLNQLIILPELSKLTLIYLMSPGQDVIFGNMNHFGVRWISRKTSWNWLPWKIVGALDIYFKLYLWESWMDFWFQIQMSSTVITITWFTTIQMKHALSILHVYIFSSIHFIPSLSWSLNLSEVYLKSIYY